MDRFLKIGFIAAVIVGIGMLFYANYKKTSNPLEEENPTLATTTQPLPGLLELGAESCPPCQMMKPILVELKKEFSGRLKVVAIDVYNHPEVGVKFAVDGIPTLIFFDSAGKVLYRQEGFMSKEEILAKWKELGIVLKK